MADYRNEKAALGGYGFKVVTDTTATTPDTGYVFIGIKALSDVVINTVDGNDGGDTLDGLTIYAGDYVPGRFTSVTLTSGNVLLYHGV